MSELPEKLAFIDIETSGNSPQYDRIIEIGILRVENGKLVNTFSTLLNPGMYVSPFIENLTGITREELEKAPTFDEIISTVRDLLDDCIFVAHNARFDYGFLKNEFKRYEVTYNAKNLCTVKLSRFLFPEYTKHNLDALIERFNIECTARHRAFDDAKVLWDFYLLLQKTLPKQALLDAVSHVLKRPSLPPQLTKQHVDALPKTPGVYLFYSDESTPLYIGKSTNIHDRVLSHFSSDYDSSRELEIAQQVKRIETIPTAGDLSAQLLESKLIKELQPLYNRKLRLRRKLTILKKTTTIAGYDSAQLCELDDIPLEDISSILGVFRSKKQAKELLNSLVRSHSLCQKLLGLEHGEGACFAHHLSWCKGACVEKENPLFYNLRFLEAFSKYKVKSWPFDGPIVLEEQSEEGKEVFLIDRWCVVKHMKEKDQDVESSLNTALSFDYDAYKILSSYIFNKSKNVHIKTSPHTS